MQLVLRLHGEMAVHYLQGNKKRKQERKLLTQAVTRCDTDISTNNESNIFLFELAQSFT